MDNQGYCEEYEQIETLYIKMLKNKENTTDIEKYKKLTGEFSNKSKGKQKCTTIEVDVKNSRIIPENYGV